MDPSSNTAATLLGLPSEVALNICRHLTTPSFIQLTSSCRQFFRLAATSREVLLQHLNNVPGIKLGLEDHALTSSDLWLLLRQRASNNLCGAHFSADCDDYSFRPGELSSMGSCLANSVSHIDLSLVSRDSLQIHHYNSQCSHLEVTPSPYADGLGRLVQVVHHGHFMTVLYAWQQPKSRHPQPLPATTDSSSPKALPARPTRVSDKSDEPIKRERSTSPSSETKIRYHLVHYDAHNFYRPVFFSIKPPKGGKHNKPRSTDPILVPIHLAIHNRLKCTITWSESSLGLRKRNTTIVMLYVCDKLPPHCEEGTYTAFKIYPPRPPPPAPRDSNETDPHRDTRQRHEKDQKYYNLLRPAATIFQQQGSLLTFYACGSTVPFTTLTIDPANSSTLAQSTLTRNHNTLFIRGEYFRLEWPFFAQHVFSVDDKDDDGSSECTQVYLHLATLLDRSPEYHPEKPIALCIVQTRVPVASEECEHYVDLENVPQQRRLGWQSRVVARLWGWGRPVVSTMTGLDVVAVSKGGTRLAISYWDKIYVWALAPEVLCEEWGEDEDEASSVASSDAGNDNADGDAVSDAGSAAEPGGHSGGQDAASVASTQPAANIRKGMIRATSYYKVTRDKRLGDVVELKPIVLKLPSGAVARRMMWKTPSTLYDSDSDTDTESESGSASSAASRSSSVACAWRKCEEAVRGTLDAQTANEDIERYSKLKTDAERRAHIRGMYTMLGMRKESLVDEAHKERKRALAEKDDETELWLDMDKEARECSQELKPTPISPSRDWGRNKMMAAVVEEIEDTGESDDESGTVSPLEQEDDVKVSAEAAEEKQAKTEPESRQQRTSSERLEHPSAHDVTCSSPDHPPLSLRPNHTDDTNKLPTRPEDNGQTLAEILGMTPAELSLARAEKRRMKGKAPMRDSPILANTNKDKADDIEIIEKRPPLPDECPSKDSPQNESTPEDDLLKPECFASKVKRKKRVSEDELMILTDRGVQVWNLGVWARGRREKVCVEEPENKDTNGW